MFCRAKPSLNLACACVAERLLTAALGCGRFLEMGFTWKFYGKNARCRPLDRTDLPLDLPALERPSQTQCSPLIHMPSLTWLNSRTSSNKLSKTSCRKPP